MFSSATKSAAPAGGYTLSKSLRFRSSASAYLSRTFGTPTNNKIYTYSVWLKRGILSSQQRIFGAGATDGAVISLESGDTIRWYDYNGTSFSVQLITTQLFRDPSAWYHLVFVYDSTQATSSNRAKIYVNGTQITALSTATYPSLNQASNYFNTAVVHNIGRTSFGGGGQYTDAYMAEINFIDGQALTPSSFGSTNATTGVWQPAAYTGTYGNNGFYLPFTNTTSTTTLGNDSSGNGNNWTPNNFSLTAGATYDSMTDVPTLTNSTTANYCVGNPIDKAGSGVLTGANLNYATSTATFDPIRATIGVSSGKWYWEVTCTGQTGASANSFMIGILTAATVLSGSTHLGTYAGGYGYYGATGNKFNNGVSAAYGATYTTNDVIGVALDLDAGTLVFYKNNVSQGTAYSSLSGTFMPAYSDAATGGDTSVAFNFGQRPFVYTPPSGYNSLNTFNLPTSTIVKGNTVMDATLYTGTGSALSVTNAGSFKPDLVWAKSRSNAIDHYEYDSVRGINQYLSPNLTAAEGTAALGGVTAFNSNGFSLGTAAGTNTSAATYVAWQWQAGQGTTSSNTSGSITSTVSVNPTAGFSIVTYTGTAANATVGHGLGVAPQLMIIKSRTEVRSWAVYHVSIGATNWLQLEQTSASTASATVFNNTAPSSSVFSIGTATVTNNTGQNYVAYCWTPIAGFSSFGTYSGNSATNGPFVYTGFRPKYLLIKRTDTTGNWLIFDSVRNTYNIEQNFLWTNGANAEQTSADVALDFLSNGFKIRQTSTNINTGTLIYAAFAENPFKYALAR